MIVIHKNLILIQDPNVKENHFYILRFFFFRLDVDYIYDLLDYYMYCSILMSVVFRYGNFLCNPFSAIQLLV